MRSVLRIILDIIGHTKQNVTALNENRAKNMLSTDSDMLISDYGLEQYFHFHYKILGISCVAICTLKAAVFTFNFWYIQSEKRILWIKAVEGLEGQHSLYRSDVSCCNSIFA